jgi:metal-responsive CopG/Arc/MetJ family transcriptional regulator
MRRTTVSLPDDLAAALAREARRRNRSASEITRDALAKHLGLAADQPRDVPFAAVGRSGHRNTARDMEELLTREWDDNARGS